MDSDALRELKSELKCLVFSNTKQMRLTDLVRDYHELFQKRIPYGEFGYSDVRDFVTRGCGDTFIVSGDDRNPVLRPVIAENLFKLNSLIQRQRGQPNDRTPRRSCHYATESNENKSPDGVETPPRNRASNQKKQTSSGAHRSKTKIERITVQSETMTKNGSLKNEVINNLKVLISERPYGICISNLTNEYRKKFNANLDYNKLGFNSVLSLCTGLPDIFKVHEDNKAKSWRLYSSDTTEEDIEHPSYSRNENCLKYTDNQYNENIEDIIDGLQALPGVSINPSLYPSDCIGHEEKIPKPSLPKLGSYIKVYVSHVYSPSYFWYQINASDYGDALTNLMYEIDIFYKKQPEKYLMPRATMKPNQYCAAIHDGIFHRACIIRNKTLDIVEVDFIDYGTIADVSTTNTRFLLKCFAELPIQGLQAQLSNIIPVDKIWKKSATSYFLQLVTNKLLYAHINGIYEQSSKNIMTIDLIDTSLDDRDLYISELLIAEGLAISNKNDSLVETSEIIFKRTYDTYCSSSYDYAKEAYRKPYIERESKLEIKSITFANENCKITLQDIVDVHGHDIEIWSLHTNNKNMTSQVFLIIEQLAFMFIKPHYSKDMINYAYKKQSSENFHCVTHPHNLKNVLLNLKEYGKTGLQKGDSLLVNTIQNWTENENYISFIPFKTFAVDIVHYNSRDWLSHEFSCLFVDCAKFMKNILNTHSLNI